MNELKLLPIDLSGLSASLLGVLPKRKFGSEGDDTVTDPDTGFQVFTAEVLLFSGADADEHFSDVIRVSVPIGPGKGPDQLLELLTAAPNTPVEVYGLTAGCFTPQGSNKARFYFKASGLAVIQLEPPARPQAPASNGSEAV